ncbi:MAG: 50S ribosomal protein L18 [Nitrososphaerota archaeon]
MSQMKILKRRPPRRRRGGLTNYRIRLKLVKSGLPRLVVRKSSRYITVQVVDSRAGGDRTILTVSSRHLSRYGWRASTKNLPAAYLTGFLAGIVAKKKGIQKAIVDIGLYTPVSGSRLFASIKGFRDAGVEVPVSEEKLPSEDRVKGGHIQEYYQMIKEQNVETQQFSKSPMEIYNRLSEHFEEVRQRIVEEWEKHE